MQVEVRAPPSQDGKDRMQEQQESTPSLKHKAFQADVRATVTKQRKVPRPLLWKLDTESQRSQVPRGRIASAESELVPSTGGRGCPRSSEPQTQPFSPFSEGVQTVGTYSLATWDHGASGDESFPFYQIRIIVLWVWVRGAGGEWRGSALILTVLSFRPHFLILRITFLYN